MTTPRVTLIVLAKAPIPGRVKTRLCPPCTGSEAAHLARAALIDTLDAVRRTPSVRPLLVLDGPPGDWRPRAIATIPQRGRGLDERIGAALAAAAGPALLVGMDTPQITPEGLAEAVDLLFTPDVDAVLGPSADGGFWALGLRRPAADVVLGVPMSTDHTGAAQHQRLLDHGRRVALLPVLRDVDTIDDAYAVARLAPTSRFAAALTQLDLSTRSLATA
jgi:rSAM/selenodomain-associated transferase 1